MSESPQYPTEKDTISIAPESEQNKDSRLEFIIGEFTNPFKLIEMNKNSEVMLEEVKRIATSTGYDSEKVGEKVVPLMIKEQNARRVQEVRDYIPRFMDILVAIQHENKESLVKKYNKAIITIVKMIGEKAAETFGVDFDITELEKSREDLLNKVNSFTPIELFNTSEQMYMQLLIDCNQIEDEFVKDKFLTVVTQLCRSLEIYEQDCLDYEEIQSRRSKQININRFQLYYLIDSLENMQSTMYSISEKLAEKEISLREKSFLGVSLLDTMNAYVYILQRLGDQDSRFKPLVKDYKERALAIRNYAKDVYADLAQTTDEKEEVNTRLKGMFKHQVDSSHDFLKVSEQLPNSKKVDGTITTRTFIIMFDGKFISSMAYPLGIESFQSNNSAYKLSVVTSINDDMRSSDEDIHDLIEFFLPKPKSPSTQTLKTENTEAEQVQKESNLTKDSRYLYNSIHKLVVSKKLEKIEGQVNSDKMIGDREFFSELNSNVISNFKVLQSLESVLFDLKNIVLKCPEENSLKKYLLKYAHHLGAEKRDNLKSKKIDVKPGSIVIDLKNGYRILLEVLEESRSVNMYYLGNYHRG